MRWFSVLSITVLILSACSTTVEPPRVGLDLTTPFAVFPSNRFTLQDDRTHTGLRLRIRPYAAQDTLFTAFPDLVDEIESLDGFGTSAAIWIRFDGPIDRRSVPSLEESTTPAAAVQLVAVEAGTRVPFEALYDGPSHTLFLYPWGTLEPKTRYAIVVRPSLLDLEGRSLNLPETRDAPARIPGITTDATVVSVFTTQSVSDTLAYLTTQPVEHTPTEWPEELTACSSSSDIGWIGRGRLRSPDYRTDENRFPNELDDAPAAQPIPAPMDVTIPYIFVLPKGAARVPVVIVQHGLTGDKESVLLCGIAQRYAAWGFATIALDAAWHGERGPGGKPPTAFDAIRTLFGVWTDGERWTTKLRYGRDAFRQTALDHHALAALVIQMAGGFDVLGSAGHGPDGLPDVSPTVFYNGESMGGIIGGMTAAASPLIKAAVLNVPGARLSNFILLSPLGLYELVARPLIEASAHIGEGDIRRFLALYQTIIERGDPINYARHWWKQPYAGYAAKSVMIQETLDDMLVPNRTTEDLARAGDLPQLVPALRLVPDMPSVEVPLDGLGENLAPALTGGMVQIKRITRGYQTQEATHGTMSTPEALDQAARFFTNNKVYRVAVP